MQRLKLSFWLLKLILWCLKLILWCLKLVLWGLRLVLCCLRLVLRGFQLWSRIFGQIIVCFWNYFWPILANFSLFLVLICFLFLKETTRSALRLSASISKTYFKNQKDFYHGRDLNQGSTDLMTHALTTELSHPMSWASYYSEFLFYLGNIRWNLHL